MAITLNGVELDKYITPPDYEDVYRARSVVYALDGTAREDLLGAPKKRIRFTFPRLEASVWEDLKNAFAYSEWSYSTVGINGYIGNLYVLGEFRLADESIPTPVLVVIDDVYYCKPFSLTFEEV